MLLLLFVRAEAAIAASAPTFLARRDYVGPEGNEGAVADLNGDGILDIITGESGYIRTWLGVGGGVFLAGPESLVNMEGASFFAVADVNGDGTPDVVFSGGLQGVGVPQGIGVCLGNGDGSFQDAVFYQAGSDTYVVGIVLGDFNGDGILDAVVTGVEGVWLFTGKRNGKFNAGVLAVSLTLNANALGGAIAAADFNGDGKLDLAVSIPAAPDGLPDGFVVLLGEGNGKFLSPQMFSQPRNIRSVVVGDVNGDERQDILLTVTGAQDVYIYYGNGEGQFSGPYPITLPNATSAAIGDVNGDGIPDLVSAGGAIAFGLGEGKFTAPVSYVVGGGFPWNVVLADLRNDLRMDIVTDADEAVSVLLNLGKGRFEDGVWTAIPASAGCGVSGDFNGDGNPDLAVNTSEGISILLGTGKAATPFVLGESITLANSGCLTVSGDLNGDGIPDLLVPSAGGVVAYLGTGNGTFTLKSTTAAISQFVVLGDFNHDGKLDFAIPGNLLALGNGDGTFQTPMPIISKLPEEGFEFIAAGDLNNDGWTDLILTDWPENQFYVLVNNRHGGFSQTVIKPIIGEQFSESPAQVTLRDLNGDGNLDAVIASISGAAGVYLGNGTGSLTFVANIAPGLVETENPIAVADMNADGIPDVMLLDSNSVSVFLGIGNGTFQEPFWLGGGPEPGYILTEDLHGQARVSGKPDIVLPDLSGGVTVLLNLTK